MGFRARFGHSHATHGEAIVRITRVFVLSALLVFPVGCADLGDSPEAGDVGGTGTVVEGSSGSYLIRSDDGPLKAPWTYYPLNLPESFRVNNLRIRFSGDIEADPTAQYAYMPIRLLHISALDETLQMVSSFTLADTNGRPAVAFHSGDSFDCSLVVSNLSDQDQVYHSTGPTVIFEIVQGDSAVATWVDGLAWTQDVRRGVIGRGQAERQGWRGPNTRARTVTLVPGAYTAVARLRYAFSTANVRDPEPIQFSVTR